MLLSLLLWMQFIWLQKCHDGKNGDWNLNCIEHQFSGWSCKPCVDCDGNPCGKYWSTHVGKAPLYPYAALGDGQCDSGRAFHRESHRHSRAATNRPNWNCEAFKYDLFVLLCSSFYLEWHFLMMLMCNGVWFLTLLLFGMCRRWSVCGCASLYWYFYPFFVK